MKYLLIVFFAGTAICCRAQEMVVKTSFGDNTGQYGKMLEQLRLMLLKQQYQQVINGRERTIFVPWVRDNVHTTKAMKYLVPDVRSFTELFLEVQNPDGMYMDYVYPIDNEVNNRFNFFGSKYVKVLTRDKLQMHRQPVEADNEYLVVEGAYAIYQSTGDTSFLKKWLPSLEKGLYYMMHDPIRWSQKYQLVKRAYTIDTWDFIYLPISIPEFREKYGDPSQGIMVVKDTSFMGIMHGDNSGLYAACRQIAQMHRALNQPVAAKTWDDQAEIIQLRTNALCWNGKYYAHFVADNGQPPYLHMDERNTLSLSNPYDVNRGLPDEKMSESIIETYKNLIGVNHSFAEWYALYPSVKPDYAGVAADTYVNGGIIIPVAGELAKAAFQHGYEAYGVDILNRLNNIMNENKGYLPVCFTPSGKVDGGLPDCWGQAAVYSAMIEGLAGVVDKSALFATAEISPRWLAAGINDADVSVAYGSTHKYVSYQYHYLPASHTIKLKVTGDAGKKTIRIMLPKEAMKLSVKLNGRPVSAKTETVGKTKYVCLETADPAPEVSVKY